MAAARQEASSFWTTRVIISMVVIGILLVSALGSFVFVIILRYRARLNRAQSRGQCHSSIIVELPTEDKAPACSPAHGLHISESPQKDERGHSLTDGNGSSTDDKPRFAASRWPAFIVWPTLQSLRPRSRSSAPDLPWPVLEVLPSLRPKQPLRRRVLSLFIKWKNDEPKREPFTVADVVQALGDVNLNTSPGDLVPIQHDPASCVSPCLARSGAGPSMPEIVVHPCDGIASFSPVLDDWSMATTSSHQIFNESDDSAVTSADSTCITVSSSSEAVTPSSISSPLQSPDVFDPQTRPLSPRRCLQVPVTSSVWSDEDQLVLVNVSNFSGKKFILDAPPGRGAFVSGLRGRRDSIDNGRSVGLGFGCDVVADHADGHLLKIVENSVKEALGELGSSSSSDSEYIELSVVLGPSSFHSDDDPETPPLRSADMTVSSPIGINGDKHSHTSYASPNGRDSGYEQLLAAFNVPSPLSSLNGTSPRSSSRRHFGRDDCDETTSKDLGDTKHHECSGGLYYGFDILMREHIAVAREAEACAM